MPNLKNYTSEVPAITSMGRIEKCLVEAGASHISKKYEDGVCTAISFQIKVNGIAAFFLLPARVKAAFKVLWEGKTEQGKRQSDEKKWLGQAERTAWKIIADWVEIQLSMIQLEQADFIQVFLPYAYDPMTDTTLYDRIKESGFKLLGNG